MGRMKDYYIDMMNEPQKWVSNISFVCPSCSEHIRQEVSVPEPNYAAEKMRDMVSDGEIEIQCDACGDAFEGYCYAGPSHCDIELSDYPDTNVSCDPPSYDRPPEDWFDETEIPDDPLSVFKLNHDELLHLIETHAESDGSSLMNRMMFAQIVTFLEAFFCDMLIAKLRDHPKRLAQFAAKDGSLQQININASDVLTDPDHVRNLVEYNLKSRLYHQFGSGKVDKKGNTKREGVVLWYAIAFEIPLTPTEDDLKALRVYAAQRHDCVHRNGVTKDGEPLTQFDKAYLQNALTLANRVVDHIAQKISEFETRSQSLQLA